MKRLRFLLPAILVITTIANTRLSAAERRDEGQNSGIRKMEADPANGFHHPYLLLQPEPLVTNPVFIIALPTPKTSTNTVDYQSAAERIALNAGPHLVKLGLPVLIPVLPRPPVALADGNFINLYIPSLSRAALLATNPALARMDLQVLAMLDNARSAIRAQNGIEVSAKAIFVGFSAAGHFATRMAVIHPDRTSAVWAGGVGGHPIIPAAAINERALTYPVGVGDLNEITGRKFDRESFSRIPMLLVQGGNDSNSSLPMTDEPSDSYSREQAILAFELLGATPMERMEKSKLLYREAGSRAEFRTYPEAAHQITPEIIRDLVQFIHTCASSN